MNDKKGSSAIHLLREEMELLIHHCFPNYCSPKLQIRFNRFTERFIPLNFIKKYDSKLIFTFIFVLRNEQHMKHGVYILMILVALLPLSKRGYAMTSSFIVANDTARQIMIYYNENDTRVDLSYKSNSQSYALLDSLLGRSSDAECVTVVNIVTFVSPDGDAAYNASLSAKRNSSVRELLQRRYPSVDSEKIILKSEGEDWAEYRKLIEEDPNVPDREEVLMLMDYHRDDIEKRKQLLRKLNRGISHRYIVSHVLPKLRRSQITVVREIPEVEIKTLEPASSASGLFVSRQEEALPDYQPIEAVEDIEMKQPYEVAASEAEEPVKSETILAVKNNLLYDLALAPNLEIEVPLGKRWSLNTEFKSPWWLNNRDDFCYQLLSGGLEGRCWLGNRRTRNRLTGHFMGLYAEGGVYDFQFGGDGCQGKYYGAAGMTYGYARQLARHFALEFSFGVGYLTTEYTQYTPYEGDIIREKSGRYNFIGPTKAKISLVWLITTRR